MSERKAMSLNERHKLLLDRSSKPKPKPRLPPSNPPPSQGEDKEEEEVETRKVKIAGRRRLCKIVSSRDDDDAAGVKEPNFNGIIDFDDVGGSPPEKIRDILDDLSSKLDCLSIDRRSVRVGDEKGGGRDGEVADYASASSSFSVSPVKAHDGGDLFDGVVESRGQSVGVCEEGDSESFVGVAEDVKFWERRGNGCLEVCGESEVDNFAGVGNNVKFEEGRSFNGKIGKFDGKTEIGGNPLIFSDSDDESCVIMGGKEQLRQDHCTGKGVENVISVDDDDDNDDYDGDSICGLVSDVNDSLSFTWKSLKYTLPDKVEKMLYPHQREGLKWLWSLHCKGTGGILGDDMGLGKTMQICGFLAGLFYSKLIKRVLVVAPKTLLSHWIKELSAVALAEKIREYYAPSAKLRDYELQYVLKVGGILLTTYDIVRNNSKFLRGDFCLNDEISEDNNAWDYVILDEGHIIKNPSTQRAKSLLEIPSSHRIIISGTPIQNNLKELWALFSFCCPSLLGDKNEFKVKYESAILRGNEKNASDREKRIGSTVAKELRERIQPYFLRRLKSEVFSESEETNSGGLSKKNEIIVWLKLTRSQRQLYEAFLNSELVLSSFDGSPLAAITILKKICDHPFLLTKRAAEDILEGMEGILNQDEIGAVEKMALHLANETDAEDSPEIHDVSCKISFIVALLDDLIPKGHNVLIFSQTRKMLNLVQEAITLRGYAFLRIDGTTKAIDRQRIVNDFQNGIGAPIFLLTSQVGGLGLTLTKADRVIVVDPAWNPSTDNQSVDRAYRIGQTKDVLVYRLMTCGTIEEKIYRMQVFKGGLFRTATEKKEQTRYFSKHDLRELFSLPKQGFDVSVTQQQMQAEHDWQNVMHDSLKRHIQFLENQGIAGISDHSLLFSKTAQTPAAEENDELSRKKESTFIGSSRSSSSNERDVNGAEFAFNPKDAKILQKKAAMATQDKPSETEIEDKIYRLRQTLANKAVVSNLPDKGERMQRQIVELNAELDRIRAAKRGNKATIDLDDISGKLQNMLSL